MLVIMLKYGSIFSGEGRLDIGPLAEDVLSSKKSRERANFHSVTHQVEQ
jgi:hypothetical protein